MSVTEHLGRSAAVGAAARQGASPSGSWQQAFVAVSLLLGEPLDAVRAALAEEDLEAAAHLAKRVASGSREARAQAIARVASEVALAVEAARLA